MFEDTAVWMSGSNLIGYLPNSGPALFLDWESARDSLLYDLGDNGYADYLVQGISDHWLSVLNGKCEGDVKNCLLIMEYVRDNYADDFNEYEWQVMFNLLVCEEAIEEVKALQWAELTQVHIEYQSFWMDYAPSIHDMMKDADLNPEDFDDATEAIEALNEMMMV